MTTIVNALKTECCEGIAQTELGFIAMADNHMVKGVCDADCLEGLAKAELRFQAKAQAKAKARKIAKELSTKPLNDCTSQFASACSKAGRKSAATLTQCHSRQAIT